MEKQYQNKSIKLLKWNEAIRTRPGMYIGSTDKLSNGTNPAIYQITKEVLDNAVDEHLSKHANKILIRVCKNEITIADNGRGIPIEYHKDFKTSTLVGVFSNMHASGKFDKDSYETSIGCFTGNTKIKLLDGTSKTLESLYKSGRVNFYVYSKNVDKPSTFEAQKCYRVLRIKQVDELIELTLDNGKKIRSTLDHPYMLYDGSYKEAENLEPGTSLASMHFVRDSFCCGFKGVRFYENAKSYGRYIHREVAKQFYGNIDGLDVHHKDGNHYNNEPSNLVPLTKEDHNKITNELGQHKWSNYRLTEEQLDARRKKQSSIMSSLNSSTEFQTNVVMMKAAKIAAFILQSGKELTEETYNANRFWGSPCYSTALGYFLSVKNLLAAGKKYLSESKEEIKLRPLTEEDKKRMASNYMSHYVVKIRRIKCKPTWVYGLSVKSNHNYLLDAGVFVKNTNGVGSKCTNALSESFKVWTNRSNKWYSVAFKKGVLTQDVKKTSCPIKGWDGGTVVSFIPDSSILDGKLDFDKLHATAKILSYITSAYVTLEKDGKSKTFHSKHGLLDYLPVLNKKLEGSMSEAFHLDKDGVNVAMCWIDKDSTVIESFVNASPTRDGGTHVKGLQKAITDAFKHVYKKANFDWQDISSGLLCALAKNVSEVKFDSQTKDRLITKEAEQETYDVVYPNLIKWIKRNNEFCDDLVAKAEKLKAIRSKATDERAVLKALKGKRGKSDLPPTRKFAISTTKNPEERVLFIVEGDSSKGACANVRNPKIHEILALRGKIMNAVASDKKIFESEEVMNILKAIGYNEKGTWRVGKVVIFADADPDGCLAPSTRILTLDGNRPTIKSLAEKWEKDHKPFEVYSVDKNNNLVVGTATHPRKTRTVEKVCEITWSNGKKTVCTLDHKWRINCVENSDKVIMQSGQEYIQAKDLTVGDSIRSVYFKQNDAGYLSIKDAKYQGKYATNAILSGTGCLVHRFVAKLFNKVRTGNQVHHVNMIKTDNRSENLQVLASSAEHRRLHANLYNASDKHREDIQRAKELGHYDNTSYFIEYNKTKHHCTFPSWEKLQGNHTVKKIRIIEKTTDVYCMTVAKHNNFMIDDGTGNGICSSNCHITSLVLGVIMTVCPKLIKDGRVYVVDAPLFIGKTATTEYYGKDLADLYRQSKSISSITRVKGWGECPAAVLKKIVFSDSAKFKQVLYDDIDYAEVKKIMGSNGLERKALLELLK